MAKKNRVDGTVTSAIVNNNTVIALANQPHRSRTKAQAKDRLPVKPPTQPLEPLRWGHWPSQQTPVVIEGQRGKWAFVGPWACGSWEAVLLVAWKERASTTADRRVVSATNVLVPVIPVTKGRRKAS